MLYVPDLRAYDLQLRSALSDRFAPRSRSLGQRKSGERGNADGERRIQSCAVQGYSAVVLSSGPEIQSLRPLLKSALPQRDILLDPEFALAGVSSGWAPRVAAVRHGSEFAGLVIAKERLLRGPRLGVAYADLTFGSSLLEIRSSSETAFSWHCKRFWILPECAGCG